MVCCKRIFEENSEKPAIVKSSIASVRRSIESGLPFKTGERLAALAKIEEQLDQGLSSPEKATARLWAMIEDELRLTRENGLYRQTVKIDGEESLVEVARLGMVAMYFRTNDGRVGKTLRSDNGWTYELIKDEVKEEQVEMLFDAFKKQIRAGYFELPNPLP